MRVQVDLKLTRRDFHKPIETDLKLSDRREGNEKKLK